MENKLKKKSKYKLLTIISLIVVLAIALLFTCQIKFGSINIPRIAYAIITVNTGKNDYVVIKESKSNQTTNKERGERFFANPKKVIISKPNGNYKLSDYAQANGYNMVEDPTYKFAIEKDGKIEEVDVSIIKYYSLWQWY